MAGAEIPTGSEHIEVERTILFSDVVASTELIGLKGDRAWRSVLDDHCRILEALAERHNGTVLKCSGDGFMLVFDDAADGVQCGLRLQTAFRVQGQLEIRIGIHSGPVSPYRDDYIGLTVHLASRFTDLAEGGEVVMSEGCYSQARTAVAVAPLERRMAFVKGVDLPQSVRVAHAAVAGSLL